MLPSQRTTLATSRTSTAWIPSSASSLLTRSSSTPVSPPDLPPSEQDASPPQEEEDDNRLDYDWKNQWYALTYESYIPDPSRSSEVTPAAVFGEPLVLWREKKNGVIYCAADRCPHRAAALSEGRLRDGQLYCLYHGWQFSGEQQGACTKIPQLLRSNTTTTVIPQRACLDMKTCRVDEGIVWVWMGSSSSSDPPTRDVPRTGVVGTKGWNVYDFMIDLPYDHSFLVENLLDPAHIAISHDRTPGGGKREDAAAYDMHVDTDSINADGFTGKFRLSTKTDGPFANFTFEAPGIVRNEVRGTLPNGKEFGFGAGLHCMPVALGRSRLFFRIYNTGLPKLVTFLVQLKPTWLRHLNSCKVLEQDVGLITTQEDHFARRPDRPLSKDYLLLKTSDTYVKAYRQWLDRVGHGMPWFQGLATKSPATSTALVGAATPSSVVPPGLAAAQHRASNQDVVETRYHRHVMHSPVTRTALRNVKRLKRAGLLVAGVSWTTVCALLLPVLRATADASTTTTTIPARRTTLLLLRAFRVATGAFPIGVVMATAMHFLEKEFHVSFKRRNQLRVESGLVP